MKKFVSLILLFVLIACSARKSEQIPEGLKHLKNLKIYSTNIKTDTIKFKPQQSYGNTGKHPIGRIGGISVEKNGRVFVLAAKKQTIEIFQPDGTFLAHIGSKGEGPGEFMTISNMKIAHNKLYVYDSRNLKKISTFSLKSFDLLNEVSVNPLSGMNNGNQFYILNDTTFLVSLVDASLPNTPRSIHFYTFNANEKKIDRSDQVLKKRIKEIYRVATGGHIDFGHKPNGRTTLIVKDNHYLYTAWSGHFLIKVYNLKGNYIQAFYYPYKNQLFNKSKYIKSVNPVFQPDIRKLTLPKTWPALNSMKIDSQNQLWVSTIVKNKKVYQWWVLKPNGKLIARFRWPRSKPIEVIKNGYLYTKEKTKKGVPQVVRYKIQMQ